MEQNVVCLHEIESITNIITVLKNTSHNGFPIVSRGTIINIA